MTMRYFFFFLIVLHGCATRCTPDQVDHGRFEGYALAFYHKPITGSGCEIKFIPICREEVEGKKNMLDVLSGKMAMSEGVSTVVGLSDARFSSVFRSAQKLTLRNYDSSAVEFRSIYVCPVKLKFSGAENNTPVPNQTGSNYLEERLSLENSKALQIKYIFSTEIQIQKIEIFDFGQ